MSTVLIVCYFIDIFIQFALIIFIWRMLKSIKLLKNTNNNRQLKTVNRAALLFLQILSVAIVSLLAFVVTYSSSEPFWGDFLLMFVLYLAMPMHGGILLMTVILHHIYKKNFDTGV